VNKCHFLGKLTHDIKVEIDNGVNYCVFELEIEEFRKAKGAEVKTRDVTYLNFEAWDSAALALQKYARAGGLIAVESVARNDASPQVGVCCEEPLGIYFRVTSFKILN
jgi:single-stranded DNA-binding protein